MSKANPNVSSVTLDSLPIILVLIHARNVQWVRVNPRTLNRDARIVLPVVIRIFLVSQVASLALADNTSIRPEPPFVSTVIMDNIKPQPTVPVVYLVPMGLSLVHKASRLVPPAIQDDMLTQQGKVSVKHVKWAYINPRVVLPLVWPVTKDLPPLKLDKPNVRNVAPDSLRILPP
jgi:hypothetical protein